MTARPSGTDLGGMLPMPPPPPTRPAPRAGTPRRHARRVGGPPRVAGDQNNPKGMQIVSRGPGAPRRPSSGGSSPLPAGMQLVPRRPSAPRPVSGKRHHIGPRPGISEREAIVAHIEMLWDHHEVPSWHRALYSARYFEAGACRRDVLLEEARALAQGNAAVLVAMKAVEEREAAVAQLQEMRSFYKNDDDFREVNLQATPSGIAAANQGSTAGGYLIEMLVRLRAASVAAVEALIAWRSSVAPLHCSNSSVVGLGVRGVYWPHGPRHEDYLWAVAHRDEVVRSFAGVLDLPSLSDPFLLHCCMPSRGALSDNRRCGVEDRPGSDKLWLPAWQPWEQQRMEAAKHMLLEQEIAGVLLTAGAQTPGGGPKGASLMPCTKADKTSDWLDELFNSKETSASQVGTPSSGHSVLPTLWPSWPQTRPQSAASHRSTSPRSTSPSLAQQMLNKQILTKQMTTDLLSSTGLNINLRSSAGKKRQTKKTEKRKIPISERRSTSLSRMSRASSTRSSSLAKAHSGSDASPKPPKSKQTQRRASRLNSRDVREDLEEDIFAVEERGSDETEGESEEFDNRATETAYPLVSRTVLSNLWKKYSHDQTLHRDTLPKLLEMAGLLYGEERREWVDEIFEEITRYNSIEHEDFWVFIERYEDRQRNAWKMSFAQLDEDHSGTLDNSEFAELMQSLGMEPMKPVLDEAIAEVDVDGSGNLDLEEFYEVMKILNEREGFSKKESDHFVEVFKKYDRNDSDHIDTSDLGSILNYLGFSLEPTDASTISREVDVDGSGMLDTHAFLVFMRKVRDREVRMLKGLLAGAGQDELGQRRYSVKPDQLYRLVSKLGYFVDDDVAEEVACAVGMNLSNYLDLEAMWKFMLTFRSREGLSQEESDAVDEAFVRYKMSEDGENMRTTEVGKVLRYMGYSMTFEEQQILTMQVDISEKGFLQKRDVQKMIRMARDQEVKEAQQIFKKICGSLAGILWSDVGYAFRAVGCLCANGNTPEITPALLDPNGLTVSEEMFLRVVRRQNKQNRHIFRINGGFSEKDLVELRERFDYFDEDGNHVIEHGELIKVVEAVFPRMSSDPKLRPKLLDIMRDVDQSGKGTLDFQDFLRLMRICRDQQDKEALSKERKAVDETHFTPSEVHEFRDLFIAQPGMNEGELPIPEIMRLVSSICKLGEKNTIELKGMLSAMKTADGKGTIAALERRRSMAPDHQSQRGWQGSRPASGRSRRIESRIQSEGGADPDGHDGCLDFADFLWLMRWILDTNFGDVRQQTEGAAAQYKLATGVEHRRNATLMNSTGGADSLGNLMTTPGVRRGSWGDPIQTISISVPKAPSSPKNRPRRMGTEGLGSARLQLQQLTSSRRQSLATPPSVPGSRRSSRRASGLQLASSKGTGIRRTSSAGDSSVMKGGDAVMKLAFKFASDPGGHRKDNYLSFSSSATAPNLGEVIDLDEEDDDDQ